MIVDRAHQASYPEPFRAPAGTLVRLDGREWDWRGHRWLWGIDPEGRGGWIPLEYLEDGRLRRDYDARELDAEEGDTVMVEYRAGGWSWCRHENGRRGWLPDEKLDKTEFSLHRRAQRRDPRAG